MSMMQRHGGWPVMQNGAAYGTKAAMSSSGLEPEYHVTHGKERLKENHKVSTVIHSPYYRGFDLMSICFESDSIQNPGGNHPLGWCDRSKAGFQCLDPPSCSR